MAFFKRCDGMLLNCLLCNRPLDNSYKEDISEKNEYSSSFEKNSIKLNEYSQVSSKDLCLDCFNFSKLNLTRTKEIFEKNLS